MTKLIKGIGDAVSKVDPIAHGAQMIAKNNPDSAGAKFFLPGAYQTNRLDAGEGLTPKLVGDPGNYFTQTEAQQQATREAAQKAAIPMPLANEQELSLARRRAAAMQQQRGGRASTILTGTTDSLGG